MKNKYTAALLAIFLGGFGLHKFYLNRPIQGIVYIFFCWSFIPAIVGLFEGLAFIGTSEYDFNRKFNNGQK